VASDGFDQEGTLPLSLRLFLKSYRFRKVRETPCTPLSKPMRECTVALVTTAGLVVPGDPPFDADLKGGDYTYRVIPDDVEVSSLEEHHRSQSFDHSGIERDRNTAFPLDDLRLAADSGLICSVAKRHLSFMGSITAPGRLVSKSAPEAASLLVQDKVDIALLAPV